MEAITVYPKDLEEVNLLKSMLEKMKISFSKDEKKEKFLNKFQLTPQMISEIEEAKKENPDNFEDAFLSLERISAKYGI